jgi:PEP-CTERM motif
LNYLSAHFASKFQQEGDYDRDGDVDAVDYDVWRAVFGSTTSLAADGSHNSVIDAADYVVWRHSIGRSAGSGAALPSADPLSASVPEPSTLMLMILAAAGWSLRRSKAA